MCSEEPSWSERWSDPTLSGSKPSRSQSTKAQTTTEESLGCEWLTVARSSVVYCLVLMNRPAGRACEADSQKQHSRSCRTRPGVYRDDGRCAFLVDAWDVARILRHPSLYTPQKSLTPGASCRATLTAHGEHTPHSIPHATLGPVAACASLLVDRGECAMTRMGPGLQHILSRSQRSLRAASHHGRLAASGIVDPPGCVLASWQVSEVSSMAAGGECAKHCGLCSELLTHSPQLATSTLSARSRAGYRPERRLCAHLG